MSLQGPLVIVADNPPGELLGTLGAAGAFPLVETTSDRAPEAVMAAKPGAILLADAAAACDRKLAEWLSREVTALAPVVPVIACAGDDETIAYREALPVAADASSQFIAARISAALRARSLHSSVLRRAATAQSDGHPRPDVPSTDPLEDATVIVTGRGRAYPALSVAIGERAGAIGTLSIETAARYLKSRETDGLILGDGFGPRNVEAFLIAVSEDTRYRDLPIGVLGNGVTLPDVEFPNIVTAADPAQLAARILPYVRLHAFEERLRRILQSFDQNGIIDPATGLLRTDVFIRDLERAINDAGERGTGLSIARFVFDATTGTRAEMDAARLVSRLVRNVDFGCREDDGSVLVAFTETDLRHAHVVARRIASVLKHTMLAPDQNRQPMAPNVTLATRKLGDSVASLLARVTAPAIAAE
jgi:GGDEF domain-containing protein